MEAHTHLSSLYSKAPIIVWVEDELTKQYLSEIWNYKDVGFLIAGSNNAVLAVVKDAEPRHVFGIIDRDFGESNDDRWMNPDVRVFRLPMFEIENYLLDTQLISVCGANFEKRSRKEIDEKLNAYAGTMIYWMSCRDVLAKYHNAIMEDFPSHPKQVIQSMDDAEDYIRKQHWYQDLLTRANTISENLSIILQEAAEIRQRQLENVEWRREYSGKELFRKVRGYVFQRSTGSKSEMDVALARSIAMEQVKTGSVPSELQALLEVLKMRVGI